MNRNKVFIGKKIVEAPWDTLCIVTIHKEKWVLVEGEYKDIEEVEEENALWRANEIAEEFQNELRKRLPHGHPLQKGT